MQNQPITRDIGQMSEADLTPLVNEALKHCRSVLTLSRSPLANSPLVNPTLVRDNVSPTAEERAHGLRLVLQWAVDQLAPGRAQHPFGQHRPFDDPTWRDALWWRYNILRHRYLDPLHPDDFVADGRFTETLIALTGIPSTDVFFAERNRAIRDVARWLHGQLRDGEADQALQQLAVQEVYPPLRRETTALQLFSIATTFADVFPRRLLLKLAQAEGIANAAEAINLLVQRRYLLSGDGDANLWMSPALRAHAYAQQSNTVLRSRHERIARYYTRDSLEHAASPLLAAHHFLEAKRTDQAAKILLTAAQELVEELEIDDLRTMLHRFRPGQLSDGLWHEVQLLLADLHQMAGEHDAAVDVCRAALKATTDRQQQGQVYRRLGKLYEQRNQQHAINYYRQAIERLDPSDPEMSGLLKDRGWLYILRRDWDHAYADLTSALDCATDDDQATMADIYDAFSGLYRRQNEYAPAIEFARGALAMREESGHPLHVAKSLGNLGLIYNDQGDYVNAIAAYQEAAITYRRLNNQELMLVAMLNTGMAHHLAGELRDAVPIYQECVDMGMKIEHTWVQIMAHSNLAEAYAQLGEDEAARHHWRVGHTLSEAHGFDDQVTYFAELRRQFPALKTSGHVHDDTRSTEGALLPIAPASGEFTAEELDPDELVAWRFVQNQGYVTAKLVMEHAVVSKATATRKLANLAGRGLLQKQGKGRGTRYVAGVGFGHADTDKPIDHRALFAHMQRQLGQRKDELRQRYELTGLGVIDPSLRARTVIPGAINMVARFNHLPDVLAFFDLENYLSDMSGRQANLIIEATMAANEQRTLTQETAWIWT